MSAHNNVFISYRRTNSGHALAVYLALKQHGYNVFFDYESIKSGNFGQAILSMIESCAHFVVILTPSSLARCKESHDWVRKEIEHALKLKRNIIPAWLGKIDYSDAKKYLIGDLAALPDFNALTIYDEYFDEAIEKIKTFLEVQHPIETSPIPDSDQALLEQTPLSDSTKAKASKDVLKAEKLFEEGFVFLENSQFDVSIAKFTEAIELYPEFDEAFYYRGRAYGNSQKIDLAIEDWKAALALEPEDIRANITRSCIFREQNQFERALLEANIGVELNPNDSDALFQRGNVKRKLKDYEGAIADYTKAISISPKFDALFYFNRGLSHVDLGQHEEALQDYSRAIEINPVSAQLLNGRGFLLYRIGNYEEALLSCLQSITIQDRLSTRDSLGQIYFALGQYAMALLNYQRAEEFLGDNTSDNIYKYVQAGLAICHYILGRETTAAEYWEALTNNLEKTIDPDFMQEELDWQPPLVDAGKRLIDFIQGK